MLTAARAYNEENYLEASSIARSVLDRWPDNVQGLNLAGACARKLGNSLQAETCFKRALAIRPDYADASSNLGNLYREQQRFEEAEAAYRQALAHVPGHPDALFQLGSLYQIQAQDTEAESCYQHLLGQVPAHANALYNLGLLLQRARRYEEALTCYQRLLAIKPARADAWTNVGNIYLESGRLDDAAIAYRTAVEFAPDNPNTHYNLATLLEKQGRHEAALQTYQAALQLRPDHGPALWKQAHMRLYLCDWRAHDAKAIQLGIESGAVSPFELLAMPELTARQLLEFTQTIAGKRGLGNLPKLPPEVLPRPHPARLRIGYLSADFYEHATTRLLAGVLEAHDRNVFAISAYAYGPSAGDAARHRVEKACERFRDVSELSDEAVAEQIRADGIDILVDLKGFTANSRQGITARRPAPIIVSWLGYPGTLGEPALADYIIGDPVVTPLQHAAHYSETLALMPHSYQPNDGSRSRPAPLPRRMVGLPEDALVFCNFNQSYKFNPETFDAWCRILAAVPDSVLWLVLPGAAAKQNLCREAQARGVTSERLIFAPHVPDIVAHLQRLQCADLALDSFPYGSHTTGSDALWMGVPLLTHEGETFASRVAASLLHAVGLPELVTQNWEDYVALAQSLAGDRQRLKALRARLAGLRGTAPLFDTPRFARNLERLYDRMWQDHLAGQRQAIVLNDDVTMTSSAQAPASATAGKPRRAATLSSLAELLRPLRQTAVVDVGANPIDGDPPYLKLLQAGLCQVTGFEPQPEALAELLRKQGEHERYLPYALGDGQLHTLNICRAPGMTSLLEPNPATLALFAVLQPLAEVLKRQQVQTRRLDDVAEIEHLDFLKIDVQGGELAVFRGGERKLGAAVVIQTEVSFVTLYRNQPTLGDVDHELRRQGFIPHAFAEMKKWPIAPCVINGNPRQPLNQLLEADLVYVRDISRPEGLTDEQLKHLALIAHYCYGSFDLALRCLQLLEGRGSLPANGQQVYLEIVGKSSAPGKP